MSSAMQLDCYKIEVLYLLNPHLIWVEVRDPAIVFDDNEIKFEQIGIYGMLPLETTIAVDKEHITVQRCEEWVPDAAARIWEFLEDEEEVFFTPIHLDQGSSIFDDNVHKFGDLVVKKRNGKIRSIIKVLKNTGFATYDVCMFHQYLSLGKINTKLSNIETHNVILELEKYFVRKNVPKNKWEDPIKRQTSVFRVSYDLEEALITTNLDKLCKDADELSAGRGSTRRGKDKKKSALEKKLELMKNRKSKNGSIDSYTTNLQTIEDTKMLLEANAAPYSKKIYSKTNALKAQILNKVMSKSAKKVSKQEKLENRLLNASREKRDRKRLKEVVETSLTRSDESLSSSGQASTSISSHASEQGDIVDKDKNIDETNCASDEIQLLKADEIAASISKPVQNVLDKNDNHIVNKYENGNNEMLITKSVQESYVKVQESVVEILKEDQVRSNVSNNVNYYHHHRRSTKGKSSKKGAKALKSKTQQQKKHSTSPLQKLAYPSLIRICEADPRNSRRVPDLPDDCEAFITKPVSEQMVNKLMSIFKLTGSKHSEMIQNAIRKCKDGGKNNAEAIAALWECRNKIIDDFGVHEDQKNLATINLDVPLVQSFSKKKLKKKAKKQNSNNGKNKFTYGPSGIDVITLSSVPPVVLYDEEIANNENQTAGATSRLNRGNTVVNGDFSFSSRVDNDLGPSCNVGAQEKEIKFKRNEPRQEKDTSPSNSSMWEKRLKLHKEMAKNKKCAPDISDTTNKDSSNPEEKSLSQNFTMQNLDEDSDDSISDIVEQLGIGYKSSEYSPAKQTVKANSFQNYDISLTVFVDRPLTPIMLHSKMNKRFFPICNLKDIHFTDHIRSVLKNLHVSRPMMLQSISWNAILRGYSVFMIGSTLSGKTMGYLPAVCRHVTDYHQSEPFCDSVGPFCIVVCATSHAVTEVASTAKMLVGCDEKVVSCHYGYDEVAIATSLLNGCDLLVTTAPFLVRLLQMSDYGVDLQRLVTFVLDDCERLSEVYSNEINFCLHKVREMCISRVNQGLNIQYIVASRIWCNFMESFAKEAPDAVVCIEAVQECVLYAKANMTISYVKEAGKLNSLFEFLNGVDPSKRTVVVCDTDEEVDFLNRSIQTDNNFIFAANSTMTVEDLYNLTKQWKEFREPMVAPVLICRDMNLCHRKVFDASYLVQYSMPSLYPIFCRRFAALIESYPSIYNSENNSNINILILLDQHDLEKLPHVVQFVKRCTNNVPDCLYEICAAILAQNDVKKAEIGVPLCLSLVSYGDCPDVYDCNGRHAILKDYDKPKAWMPKSGIVTFKILHYHAATCYSARLIKKFDAETHFKYPSKYSHMTLTMAMYYANQTNRIAFATPKVGDVCAVAVSHNIYCRAQVLIIGNTYGNGSVKNVLVNLLDEEKIETISEKHLYHLPDSFKREETFVVKVILANIQPRDKDLDFSQLLTDQIIEAISVKKKTYMRGRIVLTVGNCIFVDTLEACQDFKSLNETVVIYDLKRELLEKHADINHDHLPKIEELCRRAELEVISAEKKEKKSGSVVKINPEISWAHFEEDMVMVEFGAVENPNTVFVRLTKFKDCMKILLSEIEKHIASNTASLEDFEKEDIVLAEYPDDCVYERARIDEIGDKNIKCFFVDLGEWRQITKHKVKSISESLITQLPFQAIECRLVGIQPPVDQWTDFATNWLIDRCSESVAGASKQLYVKYYTKELAQYTGGHKYGVVVIDTYRDKDVVLNQLMIDLNLAKEDNDEIKYLEHTKCKHECEATCKEAEDDDDSWEDLSKCSTNSDSSPNKAIPHPTRSVPLGGRDDDSDSSGKWNINMTDDMAGIFIVNEASTQDVPPIESNKVEVIEESNEDSLSKNIDNCTSQLQQVKITGQDVSSKDLDSDVPSSPETAQCTAGASQNNEKIIHLNEYQIRKPKLNWRQTRTSVTIKIQLIGGHSYDLQIHDRTLTFAATVNDTKFGFEFDLYGVIDKKTASHSNKGHYILVKLNKIMHKNWLTLTKDGGIRKWIVHDGDSIDTTSDEEELKNVNDYNIIKNINKDTNSDSEEDVTYGAVANVNLNTSVTTK